MFGLTRQDLATLALPIDTRDIDHMSGLAVLSVPADQVLIAFIAPPWNDAPSPTSGLDRRRTIPPIVEIVDLLLRRCDRDPLLYAVQVHETVQPGSLAELVPRFDRPELQVYDANAPGENHGVWLGTRGI